MEQFLLAMQPWVLMEAPHLSNRIGIGLIYSFFVVGDEAGDTFFFWKKELAQNCDFKFFFFKFETWIFFRKVIVIPKWMKISKPLHKKWFHILKDPEFLSGKPADRKAVEERFLAVFPGTVIFSRLEKIEDSRRDFFFPGLRTAEEFPLVFHIFSGNLQVASEDVDFKLRCCFRL